MRHSATTKFCDVLPLLFGIILFFMPCGLYLRNDDRHFLAQVPQESLQLIVGSGESFILFIYTLSFRVIKSASEDCATFWVTKLMHRLVSLDGV